MPPKQAATGAEAKKAPAPKAEKTNAPSPVVEKKGGAAPAATEKKGEKAINNASSPATEKANNAKGGYDDKKSAQQKSQPRQQQLQQESAVGEASPKGRPTLSSDPEEAKIQEKLNKIQDEIEQHRAEVSKIQVSVNEKITRKKQMIDDKKGLFVKSGEIGSAQNFKDKRGGILDKLGKIRTLKNQKSDELSKMRKQMAGDMGEKNYLKSLDNKIAELEAKQSSGEISQLSAEKKLIEDIAKLKNSRRLFKSYSDLEVGIKQYHTEIQGLEEELNKLKLETDDFYKKKNEVGGIIDQANSNIDDLSNEINVEQDRRTVLNDQIKNLRDKFDVVKKELNEFRDNKRQKYAEDNERRKKEREAERDAFRQQRQAENQKRQDERKQKDLKRLQEELEQGPYSEEVEICDGLIKYLEPLAPRAPKAAPAAAEKSEEAASTPPPARGDNHPEGTELVRDREDDHRPLSKRNQKKKAPKPIDLEKDLRHNMEVFMQFETVSIVPPAKFADVENSLAQLKEKKAYYQKRAEEKSAKKKAELLAKTTEKPAESTETKETSETADE